jgi:DNA-binding response OmpR family regulator
MTTTDSTVLYVEDNELVRELVAMSLEDAGFNVVVAADAAMASDALSRNVEQPLRAVITDIDLGVGSDGWAAARRARELDGALPVIYVTGAHGHDWQSKAVPNAIMITKPFTAAQLVDTVASLEATLTTRPDS